MRFDRLHAKDFATLASAAFGFLALVFVPSSYWVAAVFVVLAAGLDALDGHLARAQKTANAFGRELDSLCDAVAFGAAPAFLVFWPFKDSTWVWLYAGAAVVFLSAVLIRLARFNLYAGTAGGSVPPSVSRSSGFPPLAKKSVYYGMPAPVAALVLVFLAPVFGSFVPALLLVLGGLMLAGFEVRKPF